MFKQKRSNILELQESSLPLIFAVFSLNIMEVQ